MLCACQSCMSKDHRHRASILDRYHQYLLDATHGNVRVAESLMADGICFQEHSYQKP